MKYKYLIFNPASKSMFLPVMASHIIKLYSLPECDFNIDDGHCVVSIKWHHRWHLNISVSSATISHCDISIQGCDKPH